MAAISSLDMPDTGSFAEFDESGSCGVELSVDERFACYEQDGAVFVEVELIEAEGFAEDTFDAVADDSGAELFTGSEADLTAKWRIAQDVKYETAVSERLAVGVEVGEVAQDFGAVEV